jgi:hypothetical protein
MLLNSPIRRCSAPADVLADLQRIGAALIDEVHRPADLVELARSLGTVAPHRDSGPDGVTAIEDRGAESPAMAGFTRAELSPHTDRSGIESPPIVLLTACGREPHTGGESLIVDGRAVYEDLAHNAPDALAALCEPRSVLFGGADGHLGSVFTPASDGVVAIRLRLDSLVRFSPAVAPHIPTLRAAIQRHTTVLAVRAGSGYVLNNRRWLHGRRGFEGPRLMYRVIADPLPGTVPVGFRPEDAVTSGKRALDPACGPVS